MTTFIWLLTLLFLGSAASDTHVPAAGEQYNKPIPTEAIGLVRQAKEHRLRGRLEEAAAAYRKAIALAPNYVEAHAGYIETKDYYMERDDEVRAEYLALRAKEPDNPVYVMAQILVYPGVQTRSRLSALQRVAEGAPDWAWGHFAKAMVVKSSDPATAIAELRRCTELDRVAREPRIELINLLAAHRDYDAAIDVAKGMADFPGDYRDRGIQSLWETRYKKARATSPEAMAALKAEFEPLIASTQDVEVVFGLYFFNSVVLHDRDFETALEARLPKLDPTWYPDRGLGYFRTGPHALGEENRLMGIYGEQAVLFQEVMKTAFDRQVLAGEKMERLEKVFARKPGRRVTEMLYQYLFQEAEKADNVAALVKYGEALLKIDPKSINPPIRMAMALADKKVQLDKALAYARMADAATSEVGPPRWQRDAEPFRYEDSQVEENWRKQYALARSTALDARGWVLYQMGNYTEAEATLRQSAALRRDKGNLYYWAAALKKAGRAEESASIIAEADGLLANAVKEEMAKARKEPAITFTLESIDGAKVSLADLKGKIVLVDFWATWCGPCMHEMPELIRLYDTYRDKGFELLAISGDAAEDRARVIETARKRGMKFPVLFDQGVFKQYGVSAIPTNVLVDREGNVRYRLTGGGDNGPKSLEVALNELLK